jgi:hypothetical protein
MNAHAHKRAERVCAVGVEIAVVEAENTLVQVLAHHTRTRETRITSARERPGRFGTQSR